MTAALVLVGGMGTRLRPLTESVPKPMLPIVERPIVARILEWLDSFGVNEAVFSLGYRPDAFVDAFPGDRFGDVELAYAIEESPLDTAGAIRFAAEATGHRDERVIVVNGDVLTDLDLARLLSFHEGHGGAATIALTPVEDPSAYGVVPTEADGRVIEFIEKPPPGNEPTNNVNAGIYVLEPSVLASIASDRPVSIEREIFPKLVGARELFAMVSDSYWIDTGTPEHYLRAQFDLLSGERTRCFVGAGTETSPHVFVEEGAEIDGTVGPPSFIGEGSLVKAGSRVEGAVLGACCELASLSSVRASVLLRNVVLGEGAVVEGSIIGPGAVIERGASVSGASIVGAGAHVMAGAVLSGARVVV